MIDIHINCRPDELDAHLEALGFTRNSTTKISWRVIDEPPEEMTTASETSLAKEPAAPSPSRRPSSSRAKTTASATPVHPDKPQISTGEERVDPQDTADEAAETEAAKAAGGGRLTHNDVRQAIKRYSDRFGVEAAVADVKSVIGGPINELDEDPLVLAEIIGRIDLLVSSGQRAGATKAEPQKQTARTAEPSKTEHKAGAVAQPAVTAGEVTAGATASDDGLFGPAAAPAVVTAPEPPRATRDECNEAGKTYWNKYGEAAAREDLLKLAQATFAAEAKTHKFEIKAFQDVTKVPGDQALTFGRLRIVFLDAVQKNPFNRGEPV